MSEQRLAPSELRYLLLALSKEWERALLDHKESAELTSAQIEIVLVLNESGARSMQELGEMLLLNRDPFRSVDSLVAKQLVERGPGEDKRKVLYTLSARGAAVAESIVETDFKLLKEFLKSAPLKNTRALVELLRDLQQTVAPSTVLQERFGAQQAPLGNIVNATKAASVYTNHSDVVSARLRLIVDIKYASDLRRAYDACAPLLEMRAVAISFKVWSTLVNRGGPVSDYVLDQMSEVLTGNASFLTTEDNELVRAIENQARAENALALAGVTEFGGRGTLDPDALQALAELIQKRLDTPNKG